MKNYILIIALSFFTSTFAQGNDKEIYKKSPDDITVKKSDLRIIITSLMDEVESQLKASLSEEDFKANFDQSFYDRLEAQLMANLNIKSKKPGDTTIIKIGRTTINMVDGDIDNVKMSKDDDDDNINVTKNKTTTVEVRHGFDVGLNSFLFNGQVSSDQGNLLELNQGKSIEFGLHIFNTSFNIIGDNLEIAAGLGFRFNNYHFSNNVGLQNRQDSVTVIQESINFDKNKLSARYINFPVMLKINGNEKDGKRWFLHSGADFAFLINGKTKQKSDELGTVKIKDDFNLARTNTALFARIGYSDVSIYVRYPLSSLFAQNQTETYKTIEPVAIGLTFGLN
ncbi:MAG: hypothetical protein ACJAZ3_000974 [Sphingobacteriales bacterium]|jgi:hypothetical protein